VVTCNKTMVCRGRLNRAHHHLLVWASWIGQEHRIARHHKSRKQRERPSHRAARHGALIRSYNVAIKPPKFGRQRLSQGEQTGVGGVSGEAVQSRLMTRFHDVPRSREVRLTDLHVQNSLHRECQIHDLANPRSGQAASR